MFKAADEFLRQVKRKGGGSGDEVIGHWEGDVFSILLEL